MIVLTALLIGVAFLALNFYHNAKAAVAALSEANYKHLTKVSELEYKNNQLETTIHNERKRNETIISQKKSSETRLGQISENLVPFLDGFKYDPKNCHFLGSPIDYVIFDTYSDDPAIVFLEIKTGNSKLSSNQKIIKNLIRTGKVRFEEFRLDQKGSKVKVTNNEDE